MSVCPKKKIYWVNNYAIAMYLSNHTKTYAYICFVLIINIQEMCFSSLEMVSVNDPRIYS